MDEEKVLKAEDQDKVSGGRTLEQPLPKKNVPLVKDNLAAGLAVDELSGGNIPRD